MARLQCIPLPPEGPVRSVTILQDGKPLANYSVEQYRAAAERLLDGERLPPLAELLQHHARAEAEYARRLVAFTRVAGDRKQVVVSDGLNELLVLPMDDYQTRAMKGWRFFESAVTYDEIRQRGILLQVHDGQTDAALQPGAQTTDGPGGEPFRRRSGKDRAQDWLDQHVVLRAAAIPVILLAVLLVLAYEWNQVVLAEPRPPKAVLDTKQEKVDIHTHQIVTKTLGEWDKRGPNKDRLWRNDKGKYVLAEPMVCASCGQKIPPPIQPSYQPIAKAKPEARPEGEPAAQPAAPAEAPRGVQMGPIGLDTSVVQSYRKQLAAWRPSVMCPLCKRPVFADADASPAEK